MPKFGDRVAAALDAGSAAEAGDRVHAVVIEELKRLDPAVQAKPTGYFNHSYVPDLMISWKEGAQARTRPVYLRHSLRSSRASHDLQELARIEKSAFFLSLSREEPAEEAALARTFIAEDPQSRALMTTVPAVEELARPSENSDPVLGVVKASVISSAKGVVVEDDVAKLVLPRDRRVQKADFEAFSAVVSANFTEDAVLRINRVAGIVEQALAEDARTLHMTESGQLSATEIRELVPYLLRLEGVTQSPEFWTSVARLISFDEIERYWRNFSDLDLTPLAAAGAHIWTATRALLSIRSDAVDDEAFDDAPRWSVQGRTLAAEVGNWRIAFAHAGTKLKTVGREASPARWDDLRPALERYTVTGIDLAGVATQSTYGAVEVSDMKSRIDSFIAAADDSFHVPRLTVTTGVGDDGPSISADFREMMLQAKPEATLTDLARVALDVLGYRYPAPDADLEVLLSGQRPLEGEQEEEPTGPPADGS